jgi:hypothetical protein
MIAHRMDRVRSAGTLSLIGVVALFVASCGASTHSQQPGQEQFSEAVEDSGKRLSGEFVLSAVEDAYRAKNSTVQPPAVFSFDDNGTSKRQDTSRVEEGAYLIGNQGQLVIYIEKVNGELLDAARVDRYVILDQSDDSITLQSGPSKTLILRKR